MLGPRASDVLAPHQAARPPAVPSRGSQLTRASHASWCATTLSAGPPSWALRGPRRVGLLSLATHAAERASPRAVSAGLPWLGCSRSRPAARCGPLLLLASRLLSVEAAPAQTTAGPTGPTPFPASPPPGASARMPPATPVACAHFFFTCPNRSPGPPPRRGSRLSACTRHRPSSVSHASAWLGSAHSG